MKEQYIVFLYGKRKSVCFIISFQMKKKVHVASESRKAVSC